MELHPKAQELLETLQQEGAANLSELEDGSENLMRPAQWLEEKGLAEIQETKTVHRRLTDEGENALDEGLPEEQILEKVEGGETMIEDVKGLGEIGTLGIGKAKEKDLIEIDDGILRLTEKGEETLGEEHEELEALRTVSESGDIEEGIAERLRSRGLIRVEDAVERKISLTERGQNIDIAGLEDAFDVETPVKDAITGRKHYAREVYDYIRRVWVEMGFREMEGPIVVPSLLNFDALYTPQDHPARELHDTFFLQTPETADLDRFGETVDRIRAVHETGGDTGSDGWGYDWSREESERNVLRTHTTSVSAETLSELEEEDLPVKYFSIGRNFRNETVDWKHLAEFNQTEGIVVSHDVNFRHLKGYLRQFFTRLGYGDVRLRPAYYPYTELSVEVDVYDEAAEEWVGLGGAGMFRPEVVKPLTGFEVPVLAWGLGPGRIIMRKHNISDIREMYRNDLELLRNADSWVE